MDETDGMSNNQQRRVKAESYVSETYETKNSVAGANNKSKESLSPLATSEDLEDEELANMENAESLDAACKKVLAYAVSFYQPLISFQFPILPDYSGSTYFSVNHRICDKIRNKIII